MTDQQTLATIVDGCIEDVLFGIATVEECLDRWPELRVELEPLLRAAVAVSLIPVPGVQPNPARRAAFMAELRATPQQRSRFRMPSLPAFGLGGSMLRFASVAAPAAVVALIALALVWGGNTSTASAATLTVFAGSVEQQVEGDWLPVADGSTLDEGVTIRTLDAALAMLTFPDGSTATVDASTQVALEHISVNGDRMISLVQMSGRIWNDVVPIQQGDSYVIRTPHAVVAAHGTVFETAVNGDTAVLTAEGLVSLAQDEFRVDVLAGQVVRASAQRISAPESAPSIGEVRVSGPVSAYLTSPEGAATGVLMNGLVFRQIPGITTTATEDSDNTQLQRIVLGDAEQGEYSLVLRRYAPGEGTVTVQTASGSVEVAIPENVAIARLPLEVSATAGGPLTLSALATELQSVGEVPPVRVVETERSRRAETVAATPRATERPAAAAETPPAAEQGSGGQNSTAPGTTTPTGTPRTAATTAAPQGAPDTWAGRLQDALARGNDGRLAAVLDEILDTDDDAKRATRLALLAAVMSEPSAAARIRAQAERRLVEEITTEANELTPGLADGLRSSFAPPAPNEREPDPNNRGDQPGNSGSAPGNQDGDRSPGNTGNSGNTPGNSGSGGSSDRGGSERDNRGSAPGNGENAPGNSGNAPGNSGNAPGNRGGASDSDDRGNNGRGEESSRQPEADADDGLSRTPTWRERIERLLDLLRGGSGESGGRNSAAATPMPTATPAETPRVASTAAPTATPRPAATPAPRVTATPTPTPRATATPTPTSRPAATATPTPSATATPNATGTPTVTATPAVTPAPTVSPTATPTPLPSTPSPTATPAPPTPAPTPEATPEPTPDYPWWWPWWWR